MTTPEAQERTVLKGAAWESRACSGVSVSARGRSQPIRNTNGMQFMTTEKVQWLH